MLIVSVTFSCLVVFHIPSEKPRAQSRFNNSVQNPNLMGNFNLAL